MNEEYTILMPIYGHTEFADLAVRSIQKNARLPHRLIFVVEPKDEEAVREWAKRTKASLPCPSEFIFNAERLGYYGSVNCGVRQCQTDVAVVFTSDQVAAPEWDRLLISHLAPRRFVTGRLIESGANLIADGNIWKNFGMTPEEFDEAGFERFCAAYKCHKALDVPRHYLPMAFHVEDFIAAGMFVAGKDSDAVSTYREDLYFFLRGVEKGYEMVEVQRPLTYHFQGGSRKGRFRMGFLNCIYPFGLKYVHRLATGYISLYDALVKTGARETIRRIELAASAAGQER